MIALPLAKALRQLVLLGKNNAIIAALSYVLTISLANVLGPDQFGVYTQALLVASVLSILIVFGTDQTAPVVHAVSMDERSIAGQVIGARLALGAACGVWLVVNPSLSGPLPWFIASLALANFSLAFLYEIRSANVRYSYVFLVERLLYVCACFVLIYVGQASLPNIFFLLCLVTVSSLAWQAWDTGGWAWVRIRDVPKALAQTLQTNWPLVVVSMSMFAYGGFSRMLLENQLGIEALGIYSAGWQLVTIGTMFQAQVFRVWRVTISQAVRVGDVATLKRALKLYALLAVGPMTVASVSLWFHAETVVAVLFSTAYAELADIVPVLGIYLVVISASGLVEMLWVALRSNRAYMIGNLLFSMLLLLTLAGIPTGVGMAGFATAVVATHAVATLVLGGTWLVAFRLQLAESARKDSR